MNHWCKVIAAISELKDGEARELADIGFIVVPGPVANERFTKVIESYDLAVASAAAEHVSNGRTTTRVNDFVNRGPAFDEFYLYRPVLEACGRTIGRPFKLSTLHARSVHPHSAAQDLHVDFPRDAKGWPMIGFIVMVDEFRRDNGATRLVPGSHKWSTTPAELMRDPAADHEDQLLACGPAGSVIIYNGSVWHGHSANRTNEPRRSIQGAYIRRDCKPAINFASRIGPEMAARISDLAKYLLNV